MTRPRPRPAPTEPELGLLHPTVAVLTLAGAVALLVLAGRVQAFEAMTSAAVSRATGVSDAHAIGKTVIFETSRGLGGYDVSLGCTVALLLIPFVVVTLGLLSIARVSAQRALVSLLCAVVALTVVNQLRLFVIAAGMHAWGPRVGYARTHLLLGTTISTVGVVLAGAAYLAVLLQWRPARRGTVVGGRRG